MVYLTIGIMQQYDKFFQTVESYFISSCTAERTLFLAVILQALLDATQRDTSDLESSKYKREAILWFTTRYGKKKAVCPSCTIRIKNKYYHNTEVIEPS